MRSRTGTRPSFESAFVGGKSKDAPVFKEIDGKKTLFDDEIVQESFRYDSPGSGLRSTQELPIDYTSFENHTFFNSARGKVDVAFDSIINGFPFDKERPVIEAFIDNLTGFEKYVFDKFPKNVGYLNFSNNSYLKVRDGKALNFPRINKEDYGAAVLDPGSSPFSFEMHIRVPDTANDNQVIVQRLGTSAGMTIGISQSASTSTCNLLYLISSGTDAYLVASGTIQKNQWVHFSAQLENFNGAKKAVIYLDQEPRYSSTDIQDFGFLSFDGASMFVGSGSTHSTFDYVFDPTSTLSASIDEVRYFKRQRSSAQLKKFLQREVYPGIDDLTAYFKFNEPSGSFTGSNVALDSSGNQLHSYIINYNSTNRLTGTLAPPLIYENVNYAPVLFAGYDDVVNLNYSLLEDASSYDLDNPNLIYKLVPPHYLVQGAASEGLSNVDQNLGKIYTADSIPGTGNLAKPQLLISLLLTYAKFFDELKLFIDYFVNSTYVELDDNQSAIDKFLPYIASHYGFRLPDFFSNTTPDQFYYGQTLGDNYKMSQKSLQHVRYQIWRRILGNITPILQSKGTRASIKSAILSTGIIPDNFFNIREYGGPPLRDLTGLRQQTQEVSTLADFITPNTALSSNLDAQGFFSNLPHAMTPYLSSSRIEPGIPRIAGSMVSESGMTLSNNKNDGLMTSGSFAIESIVKFKSTTRHSDRQSLFRVHTTGSTAPSSTHSCLLNVVYGHNYLYGTGSLSLYVRPSKETSAPTLELTIPGIDMFNGEKWYVAAGRIRGDLTGSLSSSYFLRCGYNEDKISYTYFTTESYFNETDADVSNNLFQNIDSSYNASGTFLVIGSQSLDTTTTRFLNTVSDKSTTTFTGRSGFIRFWSKGLDSVESLEHLRNYRSVGVQDPKINFNFDTETPGSFQRIRVDVTTDQSLTGSDLVGNIRLFDFSQNNLHMSGSGFLTGSLVIKNETFTVNRISPNIDLLQTDEKVRVRSLINPLSTDSYTQPAPVYTLGPDTSINDDNRFSIEYSSIKALSEDIIGIIGNTQTLDSALGKPALMFDEIYPELDKISKVYFNRLVSPINVRDYLELFKWFDTSLTNLLDQLLPRKTNFLGVNYVIESHLLERGRHRYLFDQQFLSPNQPRSKQDENKYESNINANTRRY